MENRAAPFYVVQNGDSLWRIAARVFGSMSDGETSRLVRKLIDINPHLYSPDHIRPGQVLFLGIEDLADMRPMGCDLVEMEGCFKYGARPDHEFLLAHFPVLQALSHYSPSLAPFYFGPIPWKSLLPGAREVTGISQKSFSLVKDALSTGLKAGNSDFGRLLKVSPYQWEVIHGELVRSLGSKARYVRTPNSLRMIPSGVRALDQGGKVILVDTAGNGFRKFSDQVKSAKAYLSEMKAHEKWVGRTAIGLRVSVAGFNMAEAWGTESQDRTLLKEGVSLASDLTLGLAAGGVAQSACLFLDFTTGVGGVACHLAVLVVYGWGAGKVSEFAGEKAAVLYESQVGKNVPE